MKLIDIALCNLRRKKGRAFFLVSGLAVGISAAVAFTSIGEAMNREIMHALDEFGASIIVLPAAEGLPLSYGGITISAVNTGGRPLTTEDAQKIKNIKNRQNISTIAPKLLVVSEVKKTKVMIAGVNFSSEFRLKKWWRITSGAMPENTIDLLAGKDAAAKLNLSPGDAVRLGSGVFRVAGILSGTGSQDDNILFADLSVIQKQFNKNNALSLIELAALCNGCPIEEMVSQINIALPGARAVAVKETVELKMQAMHYFHRFSFGISLLLLVVAGIIIFFAMTAAVKERIQEIGLFRAIGFRTSHIIKILLFEAFLVSLTAGIFGYLVGISSPRFIAPYFMSAYNLTFTPDPVLGVAAVATSIIVGLSASIYPALRASRIDPNEALKTL